MRSIKLLFTVLILTAIYIFPQNIDAKLGANGTFNIKNSVDQTLFSANENNGVINLYNLNLSGTFNQTTGIFYKDGIPFLHTFGNNNLYFGYNSGNYSLTNASNGNVAVGSATLNGLTTGKENTAIGNSALHSTTTGNYNSSLGSYTLEPNTTGTFNSAFGYASLRSNQTGNNNTAGGVSSLYNNTLGFNNTAFGFEALKTNTEGFHNTALGYQSLLNNTGNYNTALGFNAGSNVTTGSNLTLIGIDANPSSPTTTDEVTIGNIFVQTLRCNTTTITSLSDARDKKNIKDLSLGLEFLMKIHPREFNWDKREWYSDGKSDGTKMQDLPTAGFIAQELDKAQTDAEAEWLKLVLKENPDRIEASSGNLFPIVVKAVQDLKREKDTEIAQLKSENILLKKELESLKDLQTRLAKVEQVIINSDVKFSSNITE
jgi:trimeric autotransporter adhesin